MLTWNQCSGVYWAYKNIFSFFYCTYSPQRNVTTEQPGRMGVGRDGLEWVEKGRGKLYWSTNTQYTPLYTTNTQYTSQIHWYTPPIHLYYIDFHSTLCSPGTETTICGGFGFNILTVFSFFHLLRWLFHKYKVLNANVSSLITRQSTDEEYFWGCCIWQSMLCKSKSWDLCAGKNATCLTKWKKCNLVKQVIALQLIPAIANTERNFVAAPTSLQFINVFFF